MILALEDWEESPAHLLCVNLIWLLVDILRNLRTFIRRMLLTGLRR